MPRWLHWAYEGVMAGLALAVLVLLGLPDAGWVQLTNRAIWGVFAADYVVRLYLAPDRRRFIRSNIPDLIAVMPLDFLRAARLVRLARLVRAVAVLARGLRNVRGVLQTNGLADVLFFTVCLVGLGGLAIWIVEPGIHTLGDGIWWSIVTTTTVGYGDISPSTTAGRGVAAALMLVGIGTIGMITGSIATYFIDRRRNTNPHVQHIQSQLARWEELNPAERRQLAAMLAAVAGADEESAAQGRSG